MAWNEGNLDSAAAYCQVPLASAVDVASQDRQDGIQYRVGMYQVGRPGCSGGSSCCCPVQCYSSA